MANGLKQDQSALLGTPEYSFLSPLPDGRSFFNNHRVCRHERPTPRIHRSGQDIEILVALRGLMRILLARIAVGVARCAIKTGIRLHGACTLFS